MKNVKSKLLPFTAETKVQKLEEGQSYEVRFVGHPCQWINPGTEKMHYVSNVIDRKDGCVKLLELSFSIMEQIARSCETGSNVRCLECDIEYKCDDNFCSKCGKELAGKSFAKPNSRDEGHYYRISARGGKHLVKKLERAPITEQDIPKIKKTLIDLNSWIRYIDKVSKET